MPKDHYTLVSSYIGAIGDRRITDLATYVADDVTVESAGWPTIVRGLAEYTSILRRLSPIIARTEIKGIIVDRDEACVLYDFVTDAPSGAIRTVEWLTIASGRIAGIYLLFDRTRWPEAIAEIERRAAADA